MTARIPVLLVLLAGAPALAAPQPAPRAATSAPPRAAADSPSKEEAAPAEEARPPSLESRIPPVSGQAFTTSGRFELTPGLGLSLNDPFVQKFIPELALGYHLSQSLYLGLRGGYALSTFSGVVSACSETGSGPSCGPPSATQLGQLPGQMSFMGFVEAGWSPIYGKVSLFAEKVIHFDFSALLGVGAIGIGTPASPDGTVSAGSTISPALGPGLGERLFFGEHVALEAELRDYVLLSPSLTTQLMFHVGLAFLMGGGQG